MLNVAPNMILVPSLTKAFRETSSFAESLMKAEHFEEMQNFRMNTCIAEHTLFHHKLENRAH